MKKKALVIAPGRGTYNKDELGYLKRFHSDKGDLIASIDAYREKAGQESVSSLDNRASFSLSEHSRGDNASPLIFACAYADYLSINRDEYDIVAVTGNSMGWYIALACAGAASNDNALHIINTMGTLMQESLIGGQMIYSLVDENWKTIPGRREYLQGLMDEVNAKDGCEVYTSIELGGMLVFGGNAPALAALEKALKPEGRFPMKLQNHAAFHTPLLAGISDHARGILGDDLFKKPEVPMVDGRGAIWTPYSANSHAVWCYTLGHQVRRYYDFTRAVQVGVKEFAPDNVIILGPGATLGGAVAQSLIGINWQGWQSKEDFAARQKENPYILSMGMEDQRKLVTG
jgi:acyl transferase domain-containing protein